MRLAAERDADADVLRALRDSGDAPHMRRAVDVRFVGQPADVARLAEGMGDAGWTIVQVVELDDGQPAIDVQRGRTTEPAAIEALTVEALRLEQAYDVHSDGWGTVAVEERSGWWVSPHVACPETTFVRNGWGVDALPAGRSSA